MRGDDMLCTFTLSSRSVLSVRRIQNALIVVLVIGALGVAGPAGTYSEFDDAHNGTAIFEAADNFNTDGPIADAGGPYTVFEGESIELDGSQSSPDDGDYDWEITDGDGSLTDQDGDRITYNASATVDGDTTDTVELTVTADDGSSDSDTAEITVKDADSGCEATELTFCFVEIHDKGGGTYDVTYQVEDPAGGEFERVDVKLSRTQNLQNIRNEVTSYEQASTVSVAENNGGGREYRIRVELYDADGQVQCQQAIDTADGIDPSGTEDC